jgi:ABC-type multidrug transport system fused ATPase/permease subunit
MEAMRRLMNGRTTLMIAHRASTLVNCDIILSLEQGCIAEMLSPGDLDVYLYETKSAERTFVTPV